MTKGVTVKVPTTVNPFLVNLAKAEQLGLPEENRLSVGTVLTRLRELHQRIGVIPTYSCHPHFFHEIRLGEHMAFTESNVMMLATSWYGGRSNIEGATTAMASAITGKTPEYGLHIKGNRYGRALVRVRKEKGTEGFDYADYNALAYWTGKVVKDRIPVYLGLSRQMKISHAKYMCAPQIMHSCAPMFHIIGVTPEASTMEEAFGGKKPEETFAYGRKEREKTFEELCTAKEQKIDLVCLGCPHCTLEEIADIARLLGGKKVSKNVRLWIGTNEPNKTLADRMGLVKNIEDHGGLILTDMCSGTGAAIRLGEAMGIRTAATNSATFAGAAPGGSRGRVGVWFGRTKDCISAAVAGKWRAN